jgi:hypothetical protein
MKNYNLNPIQIMNNDIYKECINLNNQLRENSLNKILFICYEKNKDYIFFKYLIINYHKEIIKKIFKIQHIKSTDFKKKEINNLKIYIFNNINSFNKIIFNNKIINKIYFIDDNDFKNFYETEYIFENISFELIKKKIIN